jgi:hypothetical protein
VLEVENSILRKDAESVGAYNIVPLTYIVERFSGWTRRMEWFLEVVEYMMKGTGEKKCSGAMIIDKLCNAVQTGFVDIEEAALSLVKAAETAWLKQISAWILYGRLPSFGKDDFFVQIDDMQVRSCVNGYIPILRGLINHRNTKAIRSFFLPSYRTLRPPRFSSLADP